MNFLGDFFEGTTISVDTDEERSRIALAAFVDEETISGPHIHDYSVFVRSNELMKSSAVDLSGGSTTNKR